MADLKITQLTANTAPLTTDILPMVADPGGTPATDKVTISSLMQTILADGWTPVTDTWVFATASTFTIAGVDRTAVYTKGTRLKFTNSTLKYAVVVSSSFSTNTTVTIAVNTDYVLANAAISAPFYSYAANPQGYPTWFTFAAPTITWTAGVAPTGSSTANYKFKVDGASATVIVYRDGISGGSTITAASIPLPIACAQNYYNASGFLGAATAVIPILVYVSTTSLVMQCASTSAVDRFQATVIYPI